MIGAKTCGSCFWREVVGPNGELECWHDPPSGHPVYYLSKNPGNPDGEPQVNHICTFTIRPPVKPRDNACAVYRNKDIVLQ